MAEMKTALNPDETLTRDGAANLQRGVETVGGHLYLTNQRLVFESHRFNVQAGATEIPLGDIAEVELGWTKFLGFLPLVPNALIVRTAGGSEHRLTLFGRGEWMQAVNEARGA